MRQKKGLESYLGQYLTNDLPKLDYSCSRRECAFSVGKARAELVAQRQNMQARIQDITKAAAVRVQEQFDKVRSRIARLVEVVLEECWADIARKVVEITVKEVGVFKEAQMKQDSLQDKLQSLDRGLAGTQYKKYVAQVITTDLGIGLQDVEVEFKKLVLQYEGKAPRLLVNEHALNCLRLDIQKSVRVEGGQQPQGQLQKLRNAVQRAVLLDK